MWDQKRAQSALIGLIMLLAILLANGFISYFNLRRIDQNVAKVAASHAVLDELKNVRICMIDAETGMRGYVLSGQREFLTPYTTARSSLADTEKHLQQLIAGNSQQVELFRQLKQQIDASLTHIHGVIKLREAGEEQKAAEVIRTGNGRRLMDAMRATLATMQREEELLLNSRASESRTAYFTAITTGLFTVGLGIGLTVLAYALYIRDMRKGLAAATAMQEANEFLETRIAQRTSELSRANALMRSEIDERRLAEERVQLFAEELQRSNRELEQFASVASHDLQEPLRKIQAFGDRLRERFRDQLGPQGQDYLDRMLASAMRMRTLINDLLEYSRVTTKAHPFSHVNLGDIVQEVAGDLETRLQQTGGRLEIGELPSVRASPTQMRQLFQNLISNAMKFHKPDTPPLVRITSRNLAADESTDGSDGLQCQIVVEDNGIGFEPQYGERIFDLFQRLHGRDEYDGTGIGLAICRKIVDRHNGQIEAVGTPGEGARFIVTLPLEQQSGIGESHES